jgi:hypothetical protein
MIQEFQLTEDHLKLSKQMFVEWAKDDWGGYPYINSKRPYGNSFIEGDIAEALGWTFIDSDECPLTPKQMQEAMALHRQMQHVLQIVLCTQSFIPGLYAKVVEFDSLSWKLITPDRAPSNQD